MVVIKRSRWCRALLRRGADETAGMSGCTELVRVRCGVNSQMESVDVAPATTSP